MRRAMNQMRLTENRHGSTKKSLIFSQIKFVFIEFLVHLKQAAVLHGIKTHRIQRELVQVKLR